TRAAAGRASTSPSRPSASSPCATARTAWCGSRCAAPAARGTWGTSSRTARARRACATASTRPRSTSSRGSSRRAEPPPPPPPLGRQEGADGQQLAEAEQHVALAQDGDALRVRQGEAAADDAQHPHVVAAQLGVVEALASQLALGGDLELRDAVA